MADIGIQLRSVTRFDSRPEEIQSAPFSSVPWLIALSTLLAIRTLTHAPIATLVQIFAVALISSAPLAFVATQFAADQVAAGNRHRVFPAAIGALMITCAFSALIGAIVFGVFHESDRLLRTIAMLAQLYISMNFVALSFPAVFRRVRLITLITIAGFVLSIAGAWWGFRLLHETGLIAGFALGQIVLFALLIRLIRHEFGKGDGSLASWEILRHFKKYPHLAICGLSLAIGIWIDKVLPFPVAQDWKLISIALLSTLPGVIFFFLHLRTDFTPALRNFREAMNTGETLSMVRGYKMELTRAFHSGFTQLIAVQSVITIPALFYADQIGVILNFNSAETSLFQVALIGAFLLVVFLSLLAVLFYLNDIRGALAATLTFGICHAAIFSITLLAFPKWHGFGFVIAAGMAMLISVFRVNYSLTRLERRVFEHSV